MKLSDFIIEEGKTEYVAFDITDAKRIIRTATTSAMQNDKQTIIALKNTFGRDSDDIMIMKKSDYMKKYK